MSTLSQSTNFIAAQTDVGDSTSYLKNNVLSNALIGAKSAQRGSAPQNGGGVQMYTRLMNEIPDDLIKPSPSALGQPNQ